MSRSCGVSHATTRSSDDDLVASLSTSAWTRNFIRTSERVGPLGLDRHESVLGRTVEAPLHGRSSRRSPLSGRLMSNS